MRRHGKVAYFGYATSRMSYKSSGARYAMNRSGRIDTSEFKFTKQSQNFLNVHAADSNLFNLQRQFVRTQHLRNIRTSSFAQWERRSRARYG